MKIKVLLTSKMYLIMSTLLLTLILIYLFISSKSLENTWKSRDTTLDEQLELISLVEKEILDLYLISSEYDWEVKRKRSIMIPDIKITTYGGVYNYMFYSSKPTVTITNKSMTATKPYNFLFEIHVKLGDKTTKSYIEVEYEDGFITEFTII